MTAAQIKSVSLFFFFMLLDEDLAERASKDVLEALRSKFKKKSERVASEPEVVLIHQCLFEFKRLKQMQALNRGSLVNKTKFILAPGVNVGAWRQFHRECPEDEILALVLSQVVGFDDRMISQGLGVSEGTVRYRIGRGLRQLGELLSWGDRIA